MPLRCQNKIRYGKGFCLTDCPTARPGKTFCYVRVERPEDLPRASRNMIDVAVLDMNHGWPNLGHDSLVHAVQDATCDLEQSLEALGAAVRVVSFDVRRSAVIPVPDGRYGLFLGTGGPGHIDPARNDGVAPESQGIREDPKWEPAFFRLMECILEDPEVALLAVCHTFGVLCRWLGVAEPVLRGPEKGGKSSGILQNALADSALEHPWFRNFAVRLADGRRHMILDNRLFDLQPVAKLPSGATVLANEWDAATGSSGTPLTMMEMARDPGGVMPRVLAVNHHPEIVNVQRQTLVLNRKFERGEVTREWYEERRAVLEQTLSGEDVAFRLHLTSDFTLLAPLRYHLARIVRRHAELEGHGGLLSETDLLRSWLSAPVDALG
jgi:hypothetical protein